MRLPLFLCICAIGTLLTRALNIREVCQEVMDSDQVVANHLENPIESNCEKIFEDINIYFSKTEKLIKCLEKDKNGTIEECGDVVMEGEPKFMTIKFDYWKLMNGFKWNMSQVNNYMDWRDKSLYLWQRVDEASGRNSVYPKYK